MVEINGSLVRAPEIRRIDVFPEKDGAVLVLTVQSNPFITDIGSVKYDCLDRANQAAAAAKAELESGNTPDILVSMMHRPQTFPFRLVLCMVLAISALWLIAS
jgi:hypothetical protein